MRNKMDYLKADRCLELKKAVSRTSCGPGSVDSIASML